MGQHIILIGFMGAGKTTVGRRLAALLPDAAWEIVPGAGHEVNRDAPEALAARLRAFWTEK